VSDPLEIAVSSLAAGQIRAAEKWWRINRPKAPNAIREDLDRASALIAFVSPFISSRPPAKSHGRFPDNSAA
jgi:hypothetical protein